MASFLIEIGNGFLKGIMVLVSYITNNNVFPHPLEPEEEKKCLKRLMEGEEEVKDVLIEHNLRLVAHIVKKFDKAKSAILQIIDNFNYFLFFTKPNFFNYFS